MFEFEIFPEDCLDPNKKIADQSVDLGIFDPPFGIGESLFDKHYNRNSKNVIQGYQEAPKDYASWTTEWMTEAKRVLKPHGSMYVIIGHSSLRHVLNAAADIGLKEINHLIWKYNFGVNTTKKFVTSHYHVLYYGESEKSDVTFNLNCRFGSHEKNYDGKSILYKDLEDVFIINKDYAPNEMKNQNKIPEALIDKLIMYSSNAGDTVCDFFMGNFTTAYSALKLGRKVCGYEINQNSYDYHIERLKKVVFGSTLMTMPEVVNIVPPNKGKKITNEEIETICADYRNLKLTHESKKVREILQEKYGRGKFSIKNILDDNLKESDKLMTPESEFVEYKKSIEL